MKGSILNPLLTDLAVRFMADLPTAGMSIAPVFNTGSRSANYYVYDTSNFIDVPTDIRRAPASRFRRLTSKLSDDNFYAKDYGVEEPIDKTEIEIYGGIFNADKSAMQRSVSVVAINHEIRVRNLCRAVAQTASPTTKWNAATGTSILLDVKAAKSAIWASIGRNPNLMVLPRDVFDALEIAPELLERFKYTEGGTVTKAQMAQVFGIPNIIVAEDLINNAAEGQAASNGGIWTDEAFLCYSQPGQDLKALNFMRTFNWNAMGGSGPRGISTYTYDENEIDSRVVRARQFTDEKVIASGAGFYLSNVLA